MEHNPGASAIVGLIGLAIVAGIPTGYNHLLNNRSVKMQAYRLESRASFLYGHTEYIRFSDGSQEVKQYPIFSHRMIDSSQYLDLDGDGSVDRIRIGGSEILANRVMKLLVRDADYQRERAEFDKADETLQRLAQEYSR